MVVRRRRKQKYTSLNCYTKMRLYSIVAYKKRNSKGRGTEQQCSVWVTCSINKKYLQVQGGPRSTQTDPVPAFTNGYLNYTISRP